MKSFIFILFILSCSLHPTELFQKLVEYHPQLQSVKTQIQAKYHEAEHSNVYPDPKLGFAFRNYPYKGKLSLEDNQPDTPGMTGVEYGISQEIPYPTKLPKNKALKIYEYYEAQAQYEIEINTLCADLLSNLIELKTSEKILKILEASQKLTESIQKSSAPEYLTGKRPFGEISRAHIEKLQIQETILEWNTRKLKALGKLEYYTVNPQIYIESILEFPYFSYLENLERILENSNTLYDIPILKKAQISIQKAQIQKELGEIEHFPDTEIFFSYMKRRRPAYMLSRGNVSTLKGGWEIMDYNEFRGDLFSFGATVRVPVWSLGKRKDLNLANELNKKAEEFNLQKLQKLIQSETSTLKAELENLSKKIEFMEKDHLKVLEKNLSSIKANYQTGKSNFLEVLFAQMEILNLKIEIETLKARRMQTLISLLETYGIFSKKTFKGER